MLSLPFPPSGTSLPVFSSRVEASVFLSSRAKRSAVEGSVKSPAADLSTRSARSR